MTVSSSCSSAAAWSPAWRQRVREIIVPTRLMWLLADEQAPASLGLAGKFIGVIKPAKLGDGGEIAAGGAELCRRRE